MICPKCDDQWNSVIEYVCADEHTKVRLATAVDDYPVSGPPNAPEPVCELCLRPIIIVSSTVAKRANPTPETHPNKKTSSHWAQDAAAPGSSPGVAVSRDVMLSGGSSGLQENFIMNDEEAGGSSSGLQENVSENRNAQEAYGRSSSELEENVSEIRYAEEDSGSSRGLNESPSENRNSEEGSGSNNGQNENASENGNREGASGSSSRGMIDEEIIRLATAIAQKFGGPPGEMSVHVIVKRNGLPIALDNLQLAVGVHDFTVDANDESEMGENPH